jgi:hypothetical protein
LDPADQLVLLRNNNTFEGGVDCVSVITCATNSSDVTGERLRLLVTPGGITSEEKELSCRIQIVSEL